MIHHRDPNVFYQLFFSNIIISNFIMTQTQKVLPLFLSEKQISFSKSESFWNFLSDQKISSISDKKIIKFSP